MKKIVLIVLVVLVLAAVGASAQTWGVGVAGGLDFVDSVGEVLISVKAPQTPILWGFVLQTDPFVFGMTADWWLFNENLFSFVNLYAGPGLFFGVPNFEFGGRVPIGLNAYPIDFLELFVEIAPTWAPIVTDNDGIGIDTTNFGFQGAFGLRFWFNT